MIAANFKKDLDKIKKILSITSLLKSHDYMYKPIKPKFYKMKSRQDLANNYLDEIRNLNYTFLLTDDSFFQFEYTTNDKSVLSLRYCYFQFPYEISEYKDFLKEEYGYEYSEWGDSMEHEYFLSLIAAPLKENILFMRYDYAENGYKNGIHGASHIHIGFSNSMRLTVDKVLTPEAFLFFVLKQVYFETWGEVMEYPEFHSKFRKFKENCSFLCDELFSEDLDKCELYIT